MRGKNNLRMKTSTHKKYHVLMIKPTNTHVLMTLLYGIVGQHMSTKSEFESSSLSRNGFSSDFCSGKREDVNTRNSTIGRRGVEVMLDLYWDKNS